MALFKRICQTSEIKKQKLRLQQAIHELGYDELCVSIFNKKEEHQQEWQSRIDYDFQEQEYQVYFLADRASLLGSVRRYKEYEAAEKDFLKLLEATYKNKYFHVYMQQLKKCCLRMMELLEEECPNQKNFSGSVKAIDKLVNDIYQAAKRGVVKGDNINWKSLVRQFADEYNFKSPVIIELEKLSQTIATLQTFYKDE